MEIIGLSGKASVGKDWIFDNILRPMGYKRWALADHFKIWTIGKGGATYEEVFHTKPPHIRKLLQEEGTERGRNLYGDTVWLDTAYAWLRHMATTWEETKFCITDARFPNEVEYIQKQGGKVYRIIAPRRVAKSGLSHEARNHISETALDDYTNFDGTIYNDPEFSETVPTQINTLLGLSPIVDDPEDETLWNRFDGVFDKMNDLFDKINKKL